MITMLTSPMFLTYTLFLSYHTDDSASHKNATSDIRYMHTCETAVKTVHLPKLANSQNLS